MNGIAAALFLLATARAGVLTELPDGAREVGVLVCGDVETCTRQAVWLGELDVTRTVPVVLLDTLIEEGDPDEDAAQRFERAMTQAREKIALGHWAEAGGWLVQAEDALGRTSSTVPPQELFDLYFLLGCARIERGWPAGDAFRQAVAASWNTEVTLPADAPRFREAWRSALREAVVERAGTIRLAEAPGGAIYHLDGVPLGPGPIKVDVLPGLHRLTAEEVGGPGRWRASLLVPSAYLVETGAVFARSQDPEWVQSALRAAVLEGEAPLELREWLASWCAYHGVREVRVLVPEAEGDSWRLQSAVFRPHQRRFERSP